MRIWVPKAKIIEPRRELVFRSRTTGSYVLSVRRPDGRERLRVGPFPNLLLTAGQDRAGSNGGYLDACFVGSGNTPPAVSDTQLESLVASVSNRTQTTTVQQSPPYRARLSTTYRFAQGAAAGNLAEVGVGWATNGLWSRALILDSEGAPTTITVQPDEFLNVTYILDNYPPLIDVQGSIDISGDSYDYTLRAAIVTNNHWAFIGSGTVYRAGSATTHPTRMGAYETDILGAIDGRPSGTDSIPSTSTNSAYTPGNFYRDFEHVWDLDRGNFSTGIGSMYVPLFQQGAYQIAFSPKIPKTNEQVLAMQFRVAWAPLGS